MKTQALFQWENTIVTLCNYIWVLYRTSYKVVAREEGNEGLGYCLPHHLAQLLRSHQQHCPCISSSPSSMIFPSCPTVVHQGHPGASGGLPCDTSGQQFISGLLANGSLAPPRPHGAPHMQILPRFCGKGPEQSLQDPMGSCHAGHLASADLSHHPHGSISPSHVPCKSSLLLKSCREPCTSLHKLRVRKSETIKLKLHLEKIIHWWSSLVNSLWFPQRTNDQAELCCRVPKHPLPPALWTSSHHTVLNCKENFLMQVGRWY